MFIDTMLSFSLLFYLPERWCDSRIVRRIFMEGTYFFYFFKRGCPHEVSEDRRIFRYVMAMIVILFVVIIIGLGSRRSPNKSKYTIEGIEIAPYSFIIIIR